MTGYIALPVTREPSDAQGTMTEVIRTKWPQWKGDTSDPMTALRDAGAVLYSDAAQIASRVAEEVFRYYGRALADVPPIAAAAATAVVTISAQDDDGPYVVPEGLELVGRNGLGEPIGFRVPAQAIIPNGSTSIDLTVEATEEGTDSNGITGTGDLSEYVDYLAATFEFVTPSAGGVDEEGGDVYLDRLHEELKLSSPRPILPPDFAVLARRFGAYRATYVDGLNPVAHTTGNLGTITLGMMDAAGAPLAGVLRDFIIAQLVAMREAGWQIFGVDPTVNPIDVGYTFTPYPDVDPVAAKAAGDQAVAAYLSGVNWGAREGTGETREWFNEPVVRWGEVHDAIRRVESIRYVDSLGIALAGDTLGGAGEDVTMTGDVPVPSLGDLTSSAT